MAQNGALTPEPLPLHDIHLPAAISWWPPALGWWLLLGLLLVLIIVCVGVWRFRRRRRLKRLALRRLEELAHLPETQLATALSRLLRQVAVCHFPRRDCAGLSGQDWLLFLDRPFVDQPFSRGVGHCLSEAPYGRAVPVDGAALVALCRRWLQKLPAQRVNSGRKL